MAELGPANLGSMLRSRRREGHLSLRDLADNIDVSVNTLSRVERGHVPDLKNFRRIVEWLEVPGERFLESGEMTSTPRLIAHHLQADHRLSREAAARIAQLVDEMYQQLVVDQPILSIHLRSAQTFTPPAGALLADMLGEMRARLQASMDG